MTPFEFVRSLQGEPTVVALLQIEGWYIGNAHQSGIWGEGGLAFVEAAERALREGRFREWLKDVEAKRAERRKGAG